MSVYMAVPSGSARKVGVIVAHELFGVNPDMEGVVEQLAAAGHVAAAPELYHRDAPPGRWLSRDDQGRREGFSLLAKVTRDSVTADVTAVQNHLRERHGLEEVAMVGFSAGGHLAFLSACLLPLTRAVAIYPGWLTTTEVPFSRPAPTIELAPGLRGRLLVLFGEDDEIVDGSQQKQIRAALDNAAVTYQFVSYPATRHAFFWPNTPAFNETARDDAWGRILDFLDDPAEAP
jgi:carboxymethylenebutenolidase